jgi:predicted TIM-barrel fold metal-dependent hydrolase
MGNEEMHYPPGVLNDPRSSILNGGILNGEILIRRLFLRLSILFGLVISFGWSSSCFSQTEAPRPPISIGDFQPKPQLKVASTDIVQAKFPVVDIHSHFWIRLKHDTDSLEQFVAMMNRNNIALGVSLDGTLGQQLDDHIDYLWRNHKNRFLIFTNIDWKGTGKQDDPTTWVCNQPGFAKKIAFELAEAKTRGVSGLKVFKSFGLENRNADGSFTEIDDERFDPIWVACGELGLPVIMHTADPSAFFEPIDANNERYEELSRRPEWHFPEGKFPRRNELHAARNRLFAKHPKTTFIAAHFGNDAEDLQETSQLLLKHPNVVVEFASRISELGRQPFTSRDFFLKHSDQILFGTDGPWPEARYRAYWRFLETRDEYFAYSEKPIPPQGLWRIYGIDLPDEVLEKIYYKNAVRVIPGVKERLHEWNLLNIDDSTNPDGESPQKRGP